MVKQNKTSKKQNKAKIAIIASKFNDFVTKRLLSGCIDELRKLGIKENNVTVVWVPGAYEIPVVALKIARRNDIKAVICLGAVIKGETYHFELVAQGAAQGIAQVALMTGKPVIFEVLSTYTVTQAYKRSENNANNKGRSAAQAAVEMINILDKV